jgi:hypothetical protein
MCFADAYSTFGLYALDELESTANTFLQFNQSIRIFVLDEDVSRNWRSILWASTTITGEKVGLKIRPYKN